MMTQPPNADRTGAPPLRPQDLTQLRQNGCGGLLLLGRLKPPLPFRPLSRRSGRIPALPYPPLRCFQSGSTATSPSTLFQRTATTPLTSCLTDCPPPGSRGRPRVPPWTWTVPSQRFSADVPLRPRGLSRVPPWTLADCPPPTSGTVPRAWNTVAGAGLKRVMADSRFMGFPHSHRACDWGRWIPERNASGGVIGPGRRDEDGAEQI